MKKIALFLCGFIFFGFAAMAQPMMPQMGFKTGVFNGNLFTQEGDGKIAVKNHPVAIMVFQNGERVLMLDKTTDEKGHFEFGNIFRDPSFSYTFGTMLDEQLYLLTGLQLGADEEKKNVDFMVGKNSPNFVPDSVVQEAQNMKQPDAMMPPKAASEVSPQTAGHQALKSSQRLALLLSALVIVFAFYFALRKQRCSPQ